MNFNNKTIKKVFLPALILLAIFIATKYCQRYISAPEVLAAVEGAGLWAPVLYILMYILISGVLIPSVVIKIFAGTLFGVAGGLIVATVGATLSSSVKFLLARYLFRESVLKRIKKSERLQALDQVIEKDGWKILAILRNVPVVNSMFLNYICGVTKMSFKDFTIASFVGRLPTTIMYVYFGYMVRYTYVKGFIAEDGMHLTFKKIILYIGLAAIIAASFYLVHLSRKALVKKVPSVIT